MKLKKVGIDNFTTNGVPYLGRSDSRQENIKKICPESRQKVMAEIILFLAGFETSESLQYGLSYGRKNMAGFDTSFS